MAVLGAITSLILAILFVTVVYGLLGTVMVFMFRIITNSTKSLKTDLQKMWLLAFLFTLALYLLNWQGVLEIFVNTLK